MSKECKVCGLDLRGMDDAVYSKHMGVYYCPVPLWPACHDREEKLFSDRPSKRKKAA